MTWEGLVTKYYKKHRNEIGISFKSEVYVQSLVLKKIYFPLYRRRGVVEGLVAKYYKKHRNEIGISFKSEAYVQSLVLKRIYFSLYRRRGMEEGDGRNEGDSLVNKIIETSTEMKPVITQD